nr:DUF2339 domain-containing protein [Stakelama flava]
MLFFFIGAGVLAWCWHRIGLLERRVAELEAGMRVADAPAPVGERRPDVREDAPTTPPAEPVEPATSIATKAVPAPELRPHARTAPNIPNRLEIADRLKRLKPGFDFEEIFGRLLPIWGGGIALAIAGFFLVRWSIEVGMLTRTVRAAMGFGFGVLLLIAAECALRFEARVRDARVRQALAGAGLATLYASFYLAGSHYALIGPVASFVGMAVVTALAIGLSFRFGLPSAVLGLVGGFAAPALAGDTAPNLPLLVTYLALVTGGLAATGQRQKRPWLGVAALGGGLCWAVLMLFAAPFGSGGILALGFYLILIGAMLPALIGAGALGRISRVIAAALATAQIAALVGESGYSLLAWGCYLLLAVAIAALGLRVPVMRRAGGVAAALSVWLLAAWTGASAGWFAVIAGAMALIFAGAPVLVIARREAQRVDWGQVALYPIALVFASCVRFGIDIVAGQNALVALAALVLTGAPGFAARRDWPARDEQFTAGPFAALAGASVMTVLTILLALPGWSAPLASMIAAIAVFILLRGRDAVLPRALQWGIALTGVALLIATSRWSEATTMMGTARHIDWRAALRWTMAAVPFVLLRIEARRKAERRPGEALAALLGYGAVAMVTPQHWLPLVVAMVILAIAWRAAFARAAIATLLAIAALWAAVPLLQWSGGGLAALSGEPFLIGDLPALAHAIRYLAPFAVALIGVTVLAGRIGSRTHAAIAGLAFAVTLVLGHILFKQLFAIANTADFVRRGLAERTVWEAILALGAIGVMRAPVDVPGRKKASYALAVVALAHFAWFGMALHNPLWAAQAVGGLPLLNLLLPAYGIVIGTTIWLRGQIGQGRRRTAFDAAIMLLLSVYAISTLRQVFAGTILPGHVGQVEDLLRSILAIALALAFLAWGAKSQQRSWRIGSLVLMLLAVCKVFLFDAAGLEGLGRIASFFALGICLIGIGWFYSRQLGRTPG